VLALSEVDDDLLAGLHNEQGLLNTELEELHHRAARLKEQVEEIWKDDVEAAYELTSVFVHRGTSPSWGHYFFYSRHLPDRPDSWFKYNDSDVSVVSKDEVLADTTGLTANPYLVGPLLRLCRMVLTVFLFCSLFSRRRGWRSLIPSNVSTQKAWRLQRDGTNALIVV
jgi:ubiquitin carboxyl-terminal hydrolase 25